MGIKDSLGEERKEVSGSFRTAASGGEKILKRGAEPSAGGERVAETRRHLQKLRSANRPSQGREKKGLKREVTTGGGKE